MKTEEAFVMNKARKLCALVLSVAMVLTMGLASFAENPEEQTPVATTEEQQTPVTTTENETETTPGEEPEQDEEQPQQTVLPITVDFNEAADLESWTTDRFEPAAFTVDTTDPENGKLKITVDGTTAKDEREEPYNTDFYNTQGKAYAVNSDSMRWEISAKVDITEEMLNSETPVRTDLWASINDGEAGAVSDYPIIGFKRGFHNEDNQDNLDVGTTNSQESAFANVWRYWDSNEPGFWSVSDKTVEAGTHIVKMVGIGRSLMYFVDDEFIGGTTMSSMNGIQNVMIQSYNFGTDETYTGYSVLWDDLSVKEVESIVVGENCATVEDAVKAAKDGEEILVMPGDYNVTRDDETLVEGQAGWYLPITKSISLIGVDENKNEITDPSKVAANIYSTQYTKNGAHASQDLISVFADNVTIQGLGIMTKLDINKSLTINNANNVTIQYCKFSPIPEELFPAEGVETADGGKITYADIENDGGALYFAGDSTGSTVSNNIFVTTSLAFDSTDASSITVSNNTFEGARVSEGETMYTIGYTSWENPQVFDISESEIVIENNKFIDIDSVNFSKTTAGAPTFENNYWDGKKPSDIIVENAKNADKIDAYPYYLDEEMEETIYAEVESVKLNSTAQTLYIGESVSLRVTVTPDEASQNTVTWESSAPTVASVTAQGYVRALTKGTATITATVGGKSASCRVTVERKSEGGDTSGGRRPSSSGGGTTVVVPSNDTYFTDIDSVAWAKDQINALAANGVINGVGNNTFAPNNTVTRAEFAKMVVNAFGLFDAGATMNFVDTAGHEQDWYYPYVASAAKLGVIQGYSEDNTFRPEQTISRQDMCVMIVRACQATGRFLSGGQSITFSDAADIMDYAKDAVNQLTSAGIINGMGDNTFMPQGNATRAQAAKVIYDVLY